MDGTAIFAIGTVVGTLAKVASAAGIKGAWNGWIAFGTSLLSTWIWVFSHGGFARVSAWDDFAGFASVLLIAAGAFHIVENTPAAATAVASAATTVSKTLSGDIKP